MVFGLCAHLMMEELRAGVLLLARASIGQIRLKLLRIAAQVTISHRRIYKMRNTTRNEKSLSIPFLICCIGVYLIIIQGGTHFLTLGREFEYSSFPTTEAIIRSTTIPVGMSVVFVVSVISWLGWWKRIWCERKRLARWAWIVPVLMVLSIVIVTNYPLLGDVSPMMVVTLFGSVLLVGLGEELMFRGITLEAVRRVGGTTERKAALWTALIFGGVHLSNVFTEGPGAFLQVVVASASGLLLYVALRVSGTLIVPIILHAGWDFSLFSGNLGVDPEPYLFSPVSIVTIFVLTIIVIARRRSIWPPVTGDESRRVKKEL